MTTVHKKHFEKVLSKYLQSDSKICRFFPQISYYKAMETFSWHSNKSAVVTAINSAFVDINVFNTSAKFQLYPTYIVFNIFPIFSILVAMSINQI